jgi:hypothetical protein
MPISQVLLKNISGSPEAINEFDRYFASEVNGNKRAFLCHSHYDNRIASGLALLFKNIGVELYIDWLDHTMPDKPDVFTAKKIQDKIFKSHYFFFLATGCAKHSRWCPWEIGYANGIKKDIYIIPTSDGQSSFGNEYLDLYPCIDVNSANQNLILENFIIHRPEQGNTTQLTRDFFR